MLTPVLILEQLARHMEHGPVSTRCHVDLARIGLGVGDELGNCLGRDGRIYLHYISHAIDASDRRDVTDKIEIQVVIERLIDSVGRGHMQECIPVGCRPYDRLGSDIATCAGPVLNNERLTQAIRQPLTHEASGDVSRTTSGKTDDQAYRSCRIGLRHRNARHCREHGSACRQMQKLTAEKFHCGPFGRLPARGASSDSLDALTRRSLSTIAHSGPAVAMLPI